MISFVTIWSRARRIVDLLEVPVFPATTTAQDFPAWKLIEANKFSFSIKIQEVTLEEFPYPPDAFPSWKFVEPTKFKHFNALILQLPLEEFPATPDPPGGVGGGLIPHLNIVGVKRHRLLTTPSLAEYTTTAAQTAQEFPSWGLINSNQFDFSFKLQTVELDERPYPPDEYPSWNPLVTHRTSFVRKVQLVPELNERPYPPDRYPSWNPLVTNKIRLSHQLQEVPELNERPYPPDRYPSWNPLVTNKTRFLLHAQQVPELNERPYPPDRYPAWKGVEVNKIDFNISFQEVELDQYTPTPAPDSSEEFPSWGLQLANKFDFNFTLQDVSLDERPYPPDRYPSWLANVDSFSISFGIDRKDVLEIDEFPATPPPEATGGVGDLIPSFITKWSRARKVLELLSTPFIPPTAQEYPSWKAIPAFSIFFNNRLIEGDVQLEHPASPSLPTFTENNPSWVPLIRTRFSFDVNHQIGDEQLLRPVGPLISEEYPSWLEPKSYKVDFELGRVVDFPAISFVKPILPAFDFDKGLETAFYTNFDIKRIEGDVQLTHPATPPAYYEGYYPGSKRVETLITRFDISWQKPDELRLHPLTPLTPATLQAFIELKKFKIDFKRDHLKLLEINEYPETPEVDEEAVRPAGGWWPDYDAYQYNKRKERKRLLDLEERAERIKDRLDRELALEFRKQEREESRIEELRLLTRLAKEHKQDIEESFNEKVIFAANKAIMKGNYSAMERLERMIQRQTEEEEFLLEATRIILNQ